jgi:hypothetical protein
MSETYTVGSSSTVGSWDQKVCFPSSHLLLFTFALGVIALVLLRPKEPFPRSVPNVHAHVHTTITPKATLTQHNEKQIESSTPSFPSRDYMHEKFTFQQLGFVSSGGQVLPLFGKRKYPRSNKWEYFVVDNSENRVRIPVKSVRDEEVSNGDVVDVLGVEHIVSLYDYNTVKYNPDLW